MAKRENEKGRQRGCRPRHATINYLSLSSPGRILLLCSLRSPMKPHGPIPCKLSQSTWWQVPSHCCTPCAYISSTYWNKEMSEFFFLFFFLQNDGVPLKSKYWVTYPSFIEMKGSRINHSVILLKSWFFYFVYWERFF